MKIVLNFFFVFTMLFSNLAQARNLDIDMRQGLQALHENGVLIANNYNSTDGTLELIFDKNKISKNYIDLLEKSGMTIDIKRRSIIVIAKIDPDDYENFQNISLVETLETGSCPITTSSLTKKNSRGLAQLYSIEDLTFEIVIACVVISVLAIVLGTMISGKFDNNIDENEKSQKN